jgi:hypothetical protein
LKKVITSSLVALLALSVGFDMPASTKANDNIENNIKTSERTDKAHISKEDSAWLQGFGFSKEEIENMSNTDFERISKQFEGRNAEVVVKKQEYFKVEVSKNKNGQKNVQMIKSTKKKAMEGVEKIKKEKLNQKNKSAFINFGGNKASAAVDTENDGWITQTLTVSKSGSRHIAKTYYRWLSNPDFAYSDTIAITHGNNVDKIANSEYATHWYKDGTGTHYLASDYSADKKDYYGYADKFDLKGIGSNAAPYDHSGYMYFEFVQDNSNDSTADLYGHYSHALTSSWYSISLSAGVLSLSGSSEVNATDTHADYTY